MKVLIIDDERSIRNTLKEILEFEGHQITLAEDGAAGLEAASAGSFDVIFCDIKMPGMDGVEVLDKLAESGNETPVVMISGHGSIDTAVECIKKGAFDFIQKPLDLNRILITLKNATDKGSLVLLRTRAPSSARPRSSRRRSAGCRRLSASRRPSSVSRT